MLGGAAATLLASAATRDGAGTRDDVLRFGGGWRRHAGRLFVALLACAACVAFALRVDAAAATGQCHERQVRTRTLGRRTVDFSSFPCS